MDGNGAGTKARVYDRDQCMCDFSKCRQSGLRDNLSSRTYPKIKKKEENGK